MTAIQAPAGSGVRAPQRRRRRLPFSPWHLVLIPATILLIFPPIPMPAWLFVTVYGALELWFGVKGIERDVAHFAHLGGMLGGYLMIRYGRARRR